MPVPSTREEVSEVEASGNLKTKIITGTAMGALSVAAWYAESRGYMNGLPPPSHSLRHPALGYYGAWVAGRLSRRNKTAAMAAGGVAGNFIGESGQDFINRADHNPFNWLNLREGAHNGGDLDNLVDFACCLGGTALFVAQNNGAAAWARQKVSGLRSKLPSTRTTDSPVVATD